MRVVVSLAWARLRHRPTRWLLVAFGVAAATVLPVVTQGIAASVAAEALRYGVESLPPGDRSLAAIRSSVAMAPQEVAALDSTARGALAPLTSGPVWAQMLTRTISDGVGGIYYFGAADGLTSLVRITEGRPPSSCTPTRCEVVVLGSGTPAPPAEAGLVVVGRAVRTEPLLLAGSFDPGDGAPILLADGVAAAAQLSYLEQFQRAYAWVGPVDLQRVNALGVDGYLAASNQASIVLNRSRLSLTAPDQPLRAEASRAELSARRFFLLGGAATALLLGFGVIGAIGLRRDHVATAALLRRRGARTRHVVVLASIAAAVPVLTGVVLGAGLGALGVAILAGREGLPVWSTALDAVRSAAAPLTLGAIAAAVVVAITLLSGASARAAWRGVDIVVVAGAVTAALALARGAVTAESLEQRFDPLLVALPVLAVVCGGLLVGRAWPLLTAAAARLVPRRWLAPRLGLVGAVRDPLRPVATAAFLAAAVGIVTFAGAYQATLRQGAADQAAFAVPLDASVRVGQSLRPPLDVATSDQYVAAGLQPYGIVRSAATVRLNAAQSVTADLIGVDPATLQLVHEWDDVIGASDPATVAGAINAPGNPAGMAVPAGATRVSFPAQGDVSDVDVAVWLRLPDGRDTPVELAATGAGAVSGRLGAPAPVGARLFALTLIESEIGNTRRQHHEGEGGTALPALTGEVHLGPPVYDVASAMPGDWTGWGSTEAAVTGAASLTIAYSLTGAEVVARAGYGAEPPLPVLVDPATAALAVGGVLRCECRRPLADRGHSGGRAAPVPGRGTAVRAGRRPGARRSPGRPRPRHRLGERALAGRRAGGRCRRRPGPGAVRPAAGRPAAGPGVTPCQGSGGRWRCQPAHRQCSARIRGRVAGADAARRRRTARRVGAAVRVGERRRIAGYPAPVAVPARGRSRGDRRTRWDRDRPGAVPNHHRPGPGHGGGRHAGTPAQRCRHPTVDSDRARRRDTRGPGCVRGADRGLATRAAARPARGGSHMSSLAVRAHDVFCLYPTPRGQVAALRGLTLDIGAGERVVVHGPNGSGKTTLLRVLMGEVAPSAGTVQVCGVPLGAAEAQRARLRGQRIGLVDQHHGRSLRPEISVRDNVALQLRLNGHPARRARSKAEDVLGRLGLADLTGRRPGTLSGGEAQRVAVCAAVAHEPELVFADEPTGELDQDTADSVYDLLAAAAAGSGAALLVVSHDARAARIADRIVRIRDGRLSEEWLPGGEAAESLVVDDRGWVRLPEPLRRRTGLISRGHATVDGDSIVLRPVRGAVPTAEPMGQRAVTAAITGTEVATATGIVVDRGGRRVLVGVDLAARRGTLTAVRGRSGSGKTTLLRILCGLERPDAGQVRVGGTDLGGLDRTGLAALRRQHIGVAGQGTALLETMDVTENLDLVRLARHLPADPDLVAELISELGLTAVRDRRGTGSLGR